MTVKLVGRDIGIDQGANIALGATAVISGISWVAKPKGVHVRTCARHTPERALEAIKQCTMI